MDGLERVGLLRFAGNDQLQVLPAFSSLTVLGSLTIEDNDALVSLDGLPAITEIEGNLSVEGNQSLTGLPALESLTAVGGNLTIAFNGSLDGCRCSLAGLISDNAFTGVAGRVRINQFETGDCTSLDDVLERTCEGAFTCAGDVRLLTPDDVASFSCDALPGDLFVSGDDVQDLSPVQGLREIGGSLVIQAPRLLTLEGLEGLERVGVLSLTRTSLTDLDPLANLTRDRRGRIPAVQRGLGVRSRSSRGPARRRSRQHLWQPAAGEH